MKVELVKENVYYQCNVKVSFDDKELTLKECEVHSTKKTTLDDTGIEKTIHEIQIHTGVHTPRRLPNMIQRLCTVSIAENYGRSEEKILDENMSFCGANFDPRLSIVEFERICDTFTEQKVNDIVGEMINLEEGD